LVIAYSCIFDAEHSLLLIMHIFKNCVASTQCQAAPLLVQYHRVI